MIKVNYIAILLRPSILRSSKTISCILNLGRAVARSGSALRWGCRGREFKSRRPDQFF